MGYMGYRFCNFGSAARLLRFVGLAVFFGWLCLAPLPRAFAAPQEVRIGYVPIEGYLKEGADGDLYGLLYDYIQMLADHAGLTAVYVPGSFEETFGRLAAGEVDVVANVPSDGMLQPNAALLYSTHSISESVVYLDMGRGAPKPWAIGYDATFFRPDRLTTALGVAGLAAGEDYLLRAFPDHAAALRAAANGEIRARVASDAFNEPREGSYIPLFNARTYFVALPEHADVLQKLDEAATALELYDPAWRMGLYHEYRERHALPLGLTLAEQDYLREHPTIRVLVYTEEPYSYFDAQGEYRGVVADIAQVMASDLGVRFEFVDASPREHVAERFAAGDADVILTSAESGQTLERLGASATFPYLHKDIGVVGVVRQGEDLPAQAIAAASQEFSDRIRRAIERDFPGERHRFLASDAAALEAVADGRADIAFVTELSVRQRLADGGFFGLVTTGAPEYQSSLAIAVRKTTDPRLHSILDKEIAHLDDDQITAIVHRYLYEGAQPKTFQAFLYLYLPEVLGGIALLALLVALFLGFHLWKMRQASRRIYELAYRSDLLPMHNTRWLAKELPRLLAREKAARAAGRLVLYAFTLQNLYAIRAAYGSKLAAEAATRIVKLARQAFPGLKEDAVDMNLTQVLVLAVLPEGISPLAGAQRIQAYASALQIGKATIRARLVAGVVPIGPDRGRAPAQLIEDANVALHDAQGKGGLVSVYGEAMLKAIEERHRIETLAPAALAQGEFQIYLQPKCRIDDHALVGAEALVRWQNPELGFLSPGLFIPIFERNGFILDLDYHNLEEILRYQAERARKGLPLVTISVNQSGLHMREVGYIERMRKLKARYDVPPGAVELEITETAFVDFESGGQRQNATEIVTALRAMGYSLSMDDFTTGYSSIAMLENLPMDVMKIDRSLLLAAEKTGRARKILRDVVALGHDLEMKVITEGVETRAQEELLLAVGCHYYQGFRFGKPMPIEAFRAFAQDKVLAALE